MGLKVGDTLVIHCYKHNGKIYESSRVAYVIEINDDFIVLGDENVLITKDDGRAWRTKGSSIMFFYTNRWFNIIAQLKSNGTGITYYCNIASPFYIDDHILKYIDYDLDLRVYESGAFKILDRDEYEEHKKEMEYPDDINLIIKEELSELINMKKAGVMPFDKKTVYEYSKKFKEIKKQIKM